MKIVICDSKVLDWFVKGSIIRKTTLLNFLSCVSFEICQSLELLKEVIYQKDILVIVNRNKVSEEYLKQWYYMNKHTRFIIVGGTMSYFPPNVVGLVNCVDQFHKALENLVEIQNYQKTIIVNKNLRIFLRDIVYCEIKNRRLKIHTDYTQYDLGFKTLQSFVKNNAETIYQINRTEAINLDYVKAYSFNEIIVNDKKMICAKSRLKMLKLRLFFRVESN